METFPVEPENLSEAAHASWVGVTPQLARSSMFPSAVKAIIEQNCDADPEVVYTELVTAGKIWVSNESGIELCHSGAGSSGAGQLGETGGLNVDEYEHVFAGPPPGGYPADMRTKPMTVSRDAGSTKSGLLGMYLSGWVPPFNYSGMATRGEYWLFTLVNFIVYVAISVALGYMLGIFSSGPNGLNDAAMQRLVGINVIITLALLYYSFGHALPILVRRVRDAGYNPWWIAATFIPLVGGFIALWVFVITLLPSGTGDY